MSRFGERGQSARHGIEPFYGVMHFGMWVDDPHRRKNRQKAYVAFFHGRHPTRQTVTTK
jgi:hypothetical protein